MRADKAVFHDEDNNTISEWYYACDIEKDYISEVVAELGECPNYEQD